MPLQLANLTANHAKYEERHPSHRRQMHSADRKTFFDTELVARENNPMSIEVIGIDHIYLAVSDVERSEEFYDRIMPLLGFRKNSFQNEGDRHIQYYNRHFGFVLRPARTITAHDPLAPGLHHFCFRVEDCAAVNAVANGFAELQIECS